MSYHHPDKASPQELLELHFIETVLKTGRGLFTPATLSSLLLYGQVKIIESEVPKEHWEEVLKETALALRAGLYNEDIH